MIVFVLFWNPTLGDIASCASREWDSTDVSVLCIYVCNVCYYKEKKKKKYLCSKDKGNYRVSQ